MIEALSEPTERVSVGFQVVFALANASAFLAVLPVLSILVPAQVARIDASQTAANLAIVLPAGAVGAFFGNPLGGALSDRTTSRFGRRRPWILLGSLATAGGLALLANSYSVIWLAIGWFLVQFFGNILFSAYTAILPDRVPVHQRGTTQAILGLTSPFFMIAGSYYLGQVQDFRSGYYPIILTLIVLNAFFLWAYREPPLPGGVLPHLRLKDFAVSFWIKPGTHPDYSAAWIAWLLVWTGYGLGTGGFLFLYLQNVVGYESLFTGHAVKEGISYIQILATGFGLPIMMLAAILSDRTQQRKIFVNGGVALVFVGMVIMTVSSNWTWVAIAGTMMGVGFTIFYRLGLTMISQILPSSSSRGKDLGVINIASTVPQIITPGIGAAVLGAFAITSPTGFQILFAAGILFLLSGIWMMRKIRSIR